MIPVSLSIQGIYSYRRLAVIDFRPLIQARIFGIFGRTGSGKSTIVEAITYAIYGETERLNKRDGRSYNMMNLRSNELLIDFEFEAGNPTIRYRCLVKGQRNRKRFDDAKSYEHTAYSHDGHGWIPITLGEVQQAVGLNYENFRRAVIIPQGRFQDFLQLTDTDRTRMMKELFDLGRFELASKVANLENKNNQQISHLTGKLSNFEKPDQEWFLNQQTLIDQHLKATTQATSHLNALNQKQSRLNELASFHNERRSKQEQLNTLLIDADQIEALDTRLKKITRCRLKFKTTLEILLTNKAKIEKLLAQQLQQTHTTNTLREKHKTLEQTLGIAEVDHQKNGDRYQQLEMLQHLITQASLFSSITKLEQSFTKGNELLQQELLKIGPLKQQIETTNHQLTETRTKTAALPVLARLIQWYEQHQHLHKKWDELTLQTEQATNRLMQYNVQLTNIKQTICNAFPSLDSQLKESELAHAAAETLQNEQASLLLEEQHLALQLKLLHLAGTLTNNEPCPVCGSLHHPNPLLQSNLPALEKQQKQKREQWNKRSRLLQTTQNDLLKTTVQAETDTLRLKEIQQQRKEAHQAFTNHQSTFDATTGYTHDDEPAIRQKWAEISHWQTVQQQTEAQLELLTNQQSTLETTLARYRERIDQISTQLTDLHNQFTQSQQQHHFTTDELQKSASSLNDEITLLKKNIENATQNREQARINQQKAHEALFQAETIKQSTDQQIMETTNTINTLTQSLETSSRNDGFNGIEEVTALLTDPLNEEKAATQIATHRELFALLNSRIEELTKTLTLEPYSPDDHENTNNLTAIASDNLKTLTITLDRLQQQLKLALSQKNEIEALEHELNTAQLRGTNLATLSKLFKASGFVNFVSSIYLEQLVSFANKRFHVLTNQQLSMELSDGNNIVIRDFLNGGHIRSVKTLSGGQTFQASLSLALALADVVHARRPGTDNFFFLDEGFGSLDRESLQMVFDTLRTLRMENRIVGLISHVEELQQEIDTHITVINEDEEGSRIA